MTTEKRGVMGVGYMPLLAPGDDDNRGEIIFNCPPKMLDLLLPIVIIKRENRLKRHTPLRITPIKWVLGGWGYKGYTTTYKGYTTNYKGYTTNPEQNGGLNIFKYL